MVLLMIVQQINGSTQTYVLDKPIFYESEDALRDHMNEMSDEKHQYQGQYINDVTEITYGVKRSIADNPFIKKARQLKKQGVLSERIQAKSLSAVREV